MPFVKLDTGMLNSTVWVDLSVRNVFLTALLMAEPFEARTPMPQIEVRSLEHTGFVIPPGWYGFVPAAGTGIVRLSLIEHEEGLKALERLGAPDPESRSQKLEGRRLVRVNGGYVVVTFDDYRNKDYGNADRCKRYRERKKKSSDTHVPVANTHVTTMSDIRDMQAEAEAYTEEEIPSPVPKNGNGKLKHSDSRFSPFKDLIFRCYKKLNNDQDPPWGASESKQLKIFLQENPKIDEAAVKTLLTNYYFSKNHPPGLRPRAFIPNLCTYTREINKFNREEEGQ